MIDKTESYIKLQTLKNDKDNDDDDLGDDNTAFHEKVCKAPPFPPIVTML